MRTQGTYYIRGTEGRKDGRTDGRTEGRNAENYVPPLFFEKAGDKKYSSLSSKLELKGLVKPETASSIHSTLHLSRLNTFQCIEELFQYIEL